MQKLRSLAAVLATAASALAAPAIAQTVLPRIVVGTNPVAIAVNPVTNKAYVANAGSNNVSIIDGSTHAVVGTLGTSAGPRWVAINGETNRIYVSTLAGANTTIVDGSTDTILTTLASGGGGWTAINPIPNFAYVPRYGSADELNWISGTVYNGTAAVHGDGPAALAVNPVNNRVYIANSITGDIASLDGSVFSPNPILFCPDGAGGFKPQPAPGAGSTPCIDVPNTPASVAVNPVTNRIYALSTGTISVILGSDHTFTTLTPPGGLNGGKAIAVNPVSNKAYAIFSNAVVVVNGADNAMTVIPISSGTPMAIGINVHTNKVYVPRNNGSLTIIDGATSVASTLTGIATNANAIAVNPVTNMVYITDAAGGVTPVAGPVGEATGPVGMTTTITPLPGNSGPASGTFTLNASSAITPAPLSTVRRVWYRLDNGPWTAASGSGPYSAPYAGLAPGSHTIQAFATNGLEAPSINTDLASVPVVGNVASYAFNVPSPTSGPQMGLSRTSIDFGGQSMATSSPAEVVTITNTGSGSLDISGIVVSSPMSQFSQTNNCTSVAAGQSCTVQVTFSPAITGAALNSSTPVSGSLTIHSNAFGSPHAVSLAGQAEKSLVTHYYRAILGRAPDSGGRAFWHGEAQRVVNLGANVNETWYAMAMQFFASGEYARFPRSNEAYVIELYRTFFNRQPDPSGMSYWSGQLASGMPREAMLALFMFSAEFRGFTQAIFGNTEVRPEVDVVTDFYRGLLSRLPDNSGFPYWVQRFRTAQCQGGNAVYAEVESISSGFTLSPEYAARGRTNAQYVSDLYLAFLRRGGDSAGVQYWIDQLDSGAKTREQVRRDFVGSPEFNSRVVAIVNRGCFSG